MYQQLILWKEPHLAMAGKYIIQTLGCVKVEHTLLSTVNIFLSIHVTWFVWLLLTSALHLWVACSQRSNACTIIHYWLTKHSITHTTKYHNIKFSNSKEFSFSFHVSVLHIYYSVSKITFNQPFEAAAVITF